MRKHLSLVLLTCLTLFAFGEGSEVTNEVKGITFGILRIDSKENRTIVAVPWCEPGTNENADVCVSNFVKTANLEEGDTFHLLKKGQGDGDGFFDSWVLTKNESDNVLYWTPTWQVRSDGSATETPSPADATIGRGDAIMLIRENPGNYFYVMGQLGSGSVSNRIVAGSSSSPCYNFLASPGTSDWDVNDLECVEGSSFGSSDEIKVDQGGGKVITLTLSGSSWGMMQRVKSGLGYKNQWVAYTRQIPAGTGVWYVSHGGAPIIIWK